MEIKDYQDLIVWKKSRTLVTMIYRLTKVLPREELFALTSQMRRAAVSVPANIAEGNQRSSTKDYIHFLTVARGSNAELQTQLFICTDLGYLDNNQIKEALDLSYEIGKMINSLIASLSKQ